MALCVFLIFIIIIEQTMNPNQHTALEIIGIW